MITYELAKKLKEAGFKQGDEGLYFEKRRQARKEPFYARVYVGEALGYDESYYPDHKYDIYCPTLSELIEACGDEFRDLCKLRSPDPDNDGKKEWPYVWWRAKSHKWGKTDCEYEDGEYVCANGKTPEEAVINLWLKLNQKN